MAVYGYCRVRRRAGRRTSLASQDATVRALGATEVFCDEGVSGSLPLADRPAGVALLAALKPGDVIVAAA